MSDDSAFLLYALIFRFGIIGAGSFSIYLGYSLFRDALGSGIARPVSGSSAEASLPGAHFKLRNVTAGTLFALFGAVLVVAMVLEGNPERVSQIKSSKDGISEITSLRGDGGESIERLLEAGQAADRGGRSDEAVKLYRRALAKTAPAMNALAWIYAHDHRASVALPFAQSAVELENNNAHYLDTLAESESELGDAMAAFRAIGRAAEIDPTFKARLEQLRRRAEVK